MTSEILPVRAGGLLETLARAFERGAVDQWQEAEIREGVGLLIQLRSSLRRVHETLDRELDEGVESRSFAARYGPFAEMLSRFLADVPKARDATAGLGERMDTGELALEIAEAEKSGRALHDVLAEALARTTAPVRLDPERLRQAEADVAAGRLVRVETFEDLFGENSGA